MQIQSNPLLLLCRCSAHDRLRDPTPLETSRTSQSVTRWDMIQESIRRGAVKVVGVIERAVEDIGIEFEKCRGDVQDSRVITRKRVGGNRRFAVVIEDVVDRTLR